MRADDGEVEGRGDQRPGVVGPGRGEDIGGVGPSGKSKAEQAVDALINSVQACKTADEINLLLSSDTAAKQVAWLLDKRPEEHARLYRAVNAHRTKVDGDMPDMDDSQREAA